MFFLIISTLIEHIFHKMDHYFIKTNQPGLRAAIVKIKEELMLMGFCSVVLIVFEDQILDVCVDLSTFGGIPASKGHKCSCAQAYMSAKYPGWGASGRSEPLGRMLGSESSSPDASSSASSALSNITSSAGSAESSKILDDLTKHCAKWMGTCDPAATPYHKGLCGATVSGFSAGSGASSAASSKTGSSTRRMLLENGDHVKRLSRIAQRDLAMAAIDTCPTGTFAFIEQAALHQTHTIIFYIACAHIGLGCIVMWTAGRKVTRWALWEHYGDSEDEKAKSLLVPGPRNGLCGSLAGCKEQFTQSVDPATYIAIRRFYIARNQDKVKGLNAHEYPFHKVVRTHMNTKFSEILGIRWWMWLSLGAQLMLEGYGYGYLSLFTFSAVIVMLIAGAKLQNVNDELTRKVYLAYDCLKDEKQVGTDSIEDDKLQKMQMSNDNEVVQDLEPRFWWNDPNILETMVVFALWQNSVSVTLMIYFGGKFEWLEGFHTCYWESRDIMGSLLDFSVCVFTILLSALGVIPVYVLLSLSAHHNAKMQRRASKKALHHGHQSGHGGHGNHGSHADGGDHVDGQDKSEHGTEHKESHGDTKVVPVVVVDSDAPAEGE
jgi:hypothetical protein